MGRIISIASQKGGVGKTTTAINLGACLAQESRRVLLVDIDPQGNASSGLGINGNDQPLSVYEVLIGQSELKEAIASTALSNLDLLPAGQRLSGAEVELVGMMARETKLKGALAVVLGDAFSRSRGGKPKVSRRLLHLLLVVSNFWIGLLWAGRDNLILAVLFITSYHDLQYHAVVWFVGRKRSGNAAAPVFGAVRRMFGSMAIFVSVVVVGALLQAFLRNDFRCWCILLVVKDFRLS